jgi:hypothetical protein
VERTPERAVSAARRAAAALTGGALVVGLVGAALWLWPARVDVAPLRPQLPPPPAAVTPASPLDAGLAGRVVASNVFDVSRSAPRERWTPPDGELVTTGAALPSGRAPEPGAGFDPSPSLPALAEPTAPMRGADAPPVDAPARTRDRRVPALFGTVVSADGAHALLRLDARIPGAQLYPEGARAGGWRVVRVEADRVVLDGRGGTVTLRMPHASTPRPTDLP